MRRISGAVISVVSPRPTVYTGWGKWYESSYFVPSSKTSKWYSRYVGLSHGGSPVTMSKPWALAADASHPLWNSWCSPSPRPPPAPELCDSLIAKIRKNAAENVKGCGKRWKTWQFQGEITKNLQETIGLGGLQRVLNSRSTQSAFISRSMPDGSKVGLMKNLSGCDNMSTFVQPSTHTDTNQAAYGLYFGRAV